MRGWDSVADSGLACSSSMFDEQHRMKERKGAGGGRVANQLLFGTPRHSAGAYGGGPNRQAAAGLGPSR